MAKRVMILNGPNLNLLGQREPEIYGHTTLADIEKSSLELGEKLGFEIDCHQSNAEHELIDWIQDARRDHAGIIINPAAFSHTSVAILDALTMFEGPVIEVHLSNIYKREAFRHHSFVSGRADAIIAGCGADGYALALQQMARLV